MEKIFIIFVILGALIDIGISENGLYKKVQESNDVVYSESGQAHIMNKAVLKEKILNALFATETEYLIGNEEFENFFKPNGKGTKIFDTEAKFQDALEGSIIEADYNSQTFKGTIAFKKSENKKDVYTWTSINGIVTYTGPVEENI